MTELDQTMNHGCLGTNSPARYLEVQSGYELLHSVCRSTIYLV